MKNDHSKNFLKCWDSEPEFDYGPKIAFKNYSPSKNERSLIFDKSNRLQNRCPSDAQIVITISKRNHFFITINVRSINGHFFSKSHDSSLTVAFDKSYDDLLSQLADRQSWIMKKIMYKDNHASKKTEEALIA